MNTPLLHFAKRELQRLFANTAVLAGLGGAGVILGLMGPFGTEDSIRLMPRVFYWVFVVVVTYSSGAIIAAALSRRPRSRLFDVGVIGPVIGLVIAAELWLFNAALFGLSWADPRGMLILLANTVAVSCVVSVTARIIAEQLTPQRPSGGLIERLPYDKRGALISMSVQDHYVEITTTKGQALVLMRLSDAIREAGGGYHIHRSHWVAQDGTAKITRKSGGGEVTTTDGRTLPVSRSALPKLKEAGLLP